MKIEGAKPNTKPEGKRTDNAPKTSCSGSLEAFLSTTMGPRKRFSGALEAMKKGILSKDIKDEHERLVDEKDEAQLTKDKIDVEVEMKQSRILTVDMVQRGLQNFDKVIETLPLEDQKELIQLLIKEITIYPFDPDKDDPPDKGGSPGKDKPPTNHPPGVFKTKIRTKWLKVKMQLFEMPDISIGYNKPPNSSDSCLIGSPIL